MSPKVKAAVEKIRDAIATQTDPKRLSKGEYLEVIEEISADLEGQIEAVKDEIKGEESD